MRFDTPIRFQLYKVGELDRKTGDYDKTVEESEQIYADVTDAGAETLNLINGAFKYSCLFSSIKIHHLYFILRAIVCTKG